MESRRLLRLTASAAAALVFTVVPSAIVTSTDASAQAGGGCYNGVTVLDPYGSSCSLPGPVGKIRGSAPDANAIIACRNHPGCLANYVNGP